MGQMAPGLTALGAAKQAGYRVFDTLERTPPIDASSLEGAAPGQVEGSLELREVRWFCSRIKTKERKNIVLVAGRDRLQ